MLDLMSQRGYLPGEIPLCRKASEQLHINMFDSQFRIPLLAFRREERDPDRAKRNRPFESANKGESITS